MKNEKIKHMHLEKDPIKQRFLVFSNSELLPNEDFHIPLKIPITQKHNLVEKLRMNNIVNCDRITHTNVEKPSLIIKSLAFERHERIPLRESVLPRIQQKNISLALSEGYHQNYSSKGIEESSARVQTRFSKRKESNETQISLDQTNLKKTSRTNNLNSLASPHSKFLDLNLIIKSRNAEDKVKNLRDVLLAAMRSKNSGTNCQVNKFPAIAASSVYKINKKFPRQLIKQKNDIHRSIKVTSEIKNMYSSRESSSSNSNSYH